MAENKRAVGREYETRACAYLENNGFTIIERNFRSRTGDVATQILIQREKR